MFKLRYKRRDSLLYQTGVEYGDWCLNHIENCAHGCRYPCYAMMMAKRFGRIKTYNDWLCPILVTNALEILEKEIQKYRKKINFVHLCFMTDPFMDGYPEIQDMTLKIIAKLNENDIRVTVLTKGILPAKELLDRRKYSPENEYGITLVSLNEKFRNIFEPNTAFFRRRIESLKQLSRAGRKTWVSIEPYPTPNIDPDQDLDLLLKTVSFTDKIVFGRLNYNPLVAAYKDQKKFYEECAKNVIHFCTKNSIEYHIKFGTRISDNKKTINIFIDNKKASKQILVRPKCQIPEPVLELCST